MLEVLYEDNHLIAVWKPAGMPVQGDMTGDVCLMDEVKKYLKEKYSKPGNVFLGLLHRLDRPVEGVVLLAKTSKGASRLSEQFRTHRIKKIYQALVEGKLDRGGTLVNYILKDKRKNRVTVYDQPKEGALRAELSYEVLETKGDKTLVRVELKTGRPHQIRSQFSHVGHPIVGDVKYGGQEGGNRRAIALSAVEMGFETATGGEWKVIKRYDR